MNQGRSVDEPSRQRKRPGAAYRYGPLSGGATRAPPATAPVTAKAGARMRRQMGPKIPHLTLSATPYAAPVTPPNTTPPAACAPTRGSPVSKAMRGLVCGATTRTVRTADRSARGGRWNAAAPRILGSIGGDATGSVSPAVLKRKVREGCGSRSHQAFHCAGYDQGVDQDRK